MDREVISLAAARNDEAKMVTDYSFLYVGDCDGDVTIKLGSKSSSPLNPEEFDKITDISHIHYIYVTNTAQSGKKLVIYFERKEKRFRWF